MVALIDLVVIVVFSVIPPLLYFLLLRRQASYDGVSLRDGTKALLTGATIAIAGGAILELVLLLALFLVFDLSDTASALVLAVVLAPLVEEMIKGLCVTAFKKRMDSLESGIVFGTAVGFGFSATETAFYGASALLSDGLMFALLTIGVRAVTSAFAHGSFTGITGYGLAKWNREGRREYSWVPYYAMAVVLHGFFNGVASLGEVFDMSDGLQIATTGAIAVMVISVYVLLIRRLRQLDRASKEYYDGLKAQMAQ